MQRAKGLQKIIRDQIATPLERALWFVEHVARTKGAHHLKLGSRHLSAFKKHGIDIYLTFIAVFIVLAYAVMKLTGRSGYDPRLKKKLKMH
jgi:hypothetical protein